MNALARRKVLQGGAALAVTTAAAAAIPVVGPSVMDALHGADGVHGELAALCRQYWQEIDAFNSSPDVDDDAFYIADQPFDATLLRMIGVPARSAEDALAAVDLVIREGQESMIGLADEGEDGGPCARAYGSLLNAVRGYLASEVRS